MTNVVTGNNLNDFKISQVFLTKQYIKILNYLSIVIITMWYLQL